jgi:polysaccharide export outer membrane protein
MPLSDLGRRALPVSEFNLNVGSQTAPGSSGASVMERATRRGVAFGAASLLLSGCGFLANSGPRTTEVVQRANQRIGGADSPDAPRLDYTLVNLDPNVVAALGESERPSGFSSAFTAVPASAGVLGPGDIIGVTIFEVQSGGLFIPPEAGARPGNFVVLPQQQIDRNGFISVPFIGQVRAAGRTPAQIQDVISRRLARRALEPQAVVSIIERRSAHIAVLGDVYQSQRFPLDPGGERLLGAIARAVGPRFPAYETMVGIQRDGRREQALLSDILQDPRQNVALRSGDTVTLTREPRYFVAIGAVGQSASITQLNRRFTFDDKQLFLTEAVARAGGLQDDRANPSSVFVFRNERPEILRRLGFSGAAAALPVVYRADFAEPATIFLAQQTPLRNGDTIFVSNAPATEVEKLLRVILPIAQSSSAFNTLGR